MEITEIFEALFEINQAYCFGDREWVKKQVAEINQELRALGASLVKITLPNGKTEWVLFSTRTFGCKE